MITFKLTYNTFTTNGLYIRVNLVQWNFILNGIELKFKNNVMFNRCAFISNVLRYKFLTAIVL